MRSAAVLAFCGALALAALGGCGKAGGTDSVPAAFTILGRWRGSTELTFRVVADDDEAVLAPAIRTAARVWSSTGVIRLRPAGAGEVADVSFSFEQGSHGACLPFGVDESLAHAGPQASPSFVHFDRDRTWEERDGSGHSLAHAAAHELGHVLGLGHSTLETALMHAVPGSRAPALAPDDVAALCSLYGGGEDGAGDVTITSAASGTPVAVLRRVAPMATTDLGALDTDGDGDQELLVWRTDADGQGGLLIYHFETGPRLLRTVGPVPGVVPPATEQITGTAPDGERLLVSLLPDRGWRARSFDAEGLPRARPASALVLEGWRDEDGDGRWEETGARPSARATEWTADLDGDGVLERLERR